MASIVKMVVDRNEREIAKLRPVVTRINALEARFQEYSDEQLQETTAHFRERLDKGETLDSLIPEAFAAVREAARRTVGMRHFDVQLMGGMVLHQGRIAEMRTGEGKTLVATCPLYINALTSKGAHLVTVNPYLAKRDAVWMGPVFHALGMTLGILQHESSFQYDPDFESGDPNWPHVRPITRQQAYLCDITYGMNSEFAFDYLRDNMVWSLTDCVQRVHHYAIVDEVDSILIDEARTPHIISGEGVGDVQLYYVVDQQVARLKEEADFTVDEKQKSAALTEEGTHRIERLLGVENLTDPENHETMHHVQASLKARYCFRRDVDYVVKDGEVIIVDEFTGRMMPGRRWSDGLHQAVEAKEGVAVQQENQTVATITIQNFFRLYSKLAGMTGTAKTEEAEFRKIYGLDVVSIPTNVAVRRKDYPDIVFKSEEMKYRGVTEEILKYHVRQQPVLVGTRSIEISERLHRRLAPDRLQMLAAITLLRNRIEGDKALSSDQKREFHSFLNRRLHDPLDDLMAGQAMEAQEGPGMSQTRRLRSPGMAQDDEMEEEAEETTPSNRGPKLRGLRDLASIASKVTPRLNLNLLEGENVAELASALGITTDLEEGEARALEDSLAAVLKDGIPAAVLNAKYHEREAEIIAEAGRLGAVTIATNMAGRGVDILLGGKNNPDAAEVGARVRELGGLHIIGSERHESRRIDNQLRGRSGRQGDPGSSRYFVSLEDELWRLFGDRTKSFGMNLWEEWLAIDARQISWMIERTQKKVELYHFDIRKHTLQYDEVLNDQRTIIYRERRKILEHADLKENIETYIGELVNQEVDRFCSAEIRPDDWDYKGLWEALNEFYPLVFYAGKPEELQGKPRQELIEFLEEAALKEYRAKEEDLGSETMRELERYFALQFLTSKWMDHLDAMDYLRENIGLRGYAQVDPVLAYRKEGANYFDQLVNSWKRDLVSAIYNVQMEARQPEMLQPAPRQMRMIENISGEDGHDPITEMARGAAPATDPEPALVGAAAAASQAARTDGARSAGGNGAGGRERSAGITVVNPEKVGRNDSCPCGSGKKYKRCHGASEG